MQIGGIPGQPQQPADTGKKGQAVIAEPDARTNSVLIFASATT